MCVSNFHVAGDDRLLLLLPPPSHPFPCIFPLYQDVYPRESVLYSNRAICHHKLSKLEPCMCVWLTT